MCRHILYYQQLYCFPLFLLTCSQCKTYHPYLAIQTSYLLQTRQQTFANIARSNNYTVERLMIVISHYSNHNLTINIAYITQMMISLNNITHCMTLLPQGHNFVLPKLKYQRARNSLTDRSLY